SQPAAADEPPAEAATEAEQQQPAAAAPRPQQGKKRRRRPQQRTSAAAEAQADADELRDRLLSRGKRAGQSGEAVKSEERLLLPPFLTASGNPGDDSSAWSVTNPAAAAAAAAATAAAAAAASSAAVKPDVQFPAADRLCRQSAWVCALCGRGNSCVLGLGPLYGPYYLPEELVQERLVPLGIVFGSGAKRSGSAQRAAASAAGVSRQRVTRNGEAWLHLDCALWAPDLHLSASADPAGGGGGLKLRGLAECLAGGAGGDCAVCGMWGAQVACAHRQCQSAAHLPCAIEAGCLLDEEKLIAYCAQHRQGGGKAGPRPPAS
ncbi:hypothetical protein BOX15_Mlig019755g2, partial [Macrostomum lignano]